MKHSIFFLLLLLCSSGLLAQADIFKNGSLRPGFDMGVNSSENQQNYVSSAGDSMTIAFPEEQSWAAVFITVGKPARWGKTTRQTQLHQKDLSEYKSITLKMRGKNGGESVELGIKDSDDPDDGSECKQEFTLSSEWKTYILQISELAGNCDPGSPLDLTRIYVPLEFVYTNARAQTIFVKDIRYE